MKKLMIFLLIALCLVTSVQAKNWTFQNYTVVINDSLFVNKVNISQWSFNQSDLFLVYVNFTDYNPFDQDLNTTNQVTFHNLTITNNLSVLNEFFANHTTILHYHTPQSDIEFNFYDDGSEIFLNSTEAEAFNIETDGSKIIMFDDPKQANDYKLFQVFNKVAQTETEFTITQAGPELTSYFIRSLSLVGNGTFIPVPHNCSTFAENIDCQTDVTGPDFYVLDDGEINGSLYVKEAIWINGTNLSLWAFNQSNVPWHYNQTEATGWIRSGTDVILINLGDNVGIGVIDPVETFEVNSSTPVAATFNAKGSFLNAMLDIVQLTVRGEGALSDGFGASWAMFVQNQSEFDQIAEIGAIMDGATNEGALRFLAGTDGLEEFLRISSAGNVGIGTVGPTHPLSVSSTGTDLAIFNTTAGEGIFQIGTNQILTHSRLRITGGTNRDAQISLQSGAGNVRWNLTVNGNTAGDPLEFKTDAVGATPVLLLEDSGEVGINTATPDAELEIAGNGVLLHMDSAGNAIMSLDKSAAARRGDIQFQTAGSTKWSIGTPDSDIFGSGDEFFIGPGSTSASLWIERTGLVGINTTTPTHALSLVGLFNFTAGGLIGGAIRYAAPAGIQAATLCINATTGNVTGNAGDACTSSPYLYHGDGRYFSKILVLGKDRPLTQKKYLEFYTLDNNLNFTIKNIEDEYDYIDRIALDVECMNGREMTSTRFNVSYASKIAGTLDVADKTYLVLERGEEIYFDFNPNRLSVSDCGKTSLALVVTGYYHRTAEDEFPGIFAPYLDDATEQRKPTLMPQL